MSSVTTTPMQLVRLGVAVIVVATMLLLAGHLDRAHAAFGLESFTAGVTSTEAAGHPDGTTSFSLTTRPDGSPDGELRNVNVAIPPGLVGNPRAVSSCTVGALAEGVYCPRESIVGVAKAELYGGVFITFVHLPLFSVDPPKGIPASFAFNIAGTIVRLDAHVRSDGDYGVTVKVQEVNSQLGLRSSEVTLWGVPADHQGPGPLSWNSLQLPPSFGDPTYGGPVPGRPRKSFLTNPSECGVPRTTTISASTYAGQLVTGESEPTTIDGCENLVFAPSISTSSSSVVPDSPTGLGLGLKFRHNDNPDGVDTPPLRKAVVTLPEGLTINPAAADGLAACSDAQLGLRSKAPVACPGGSKVGSVTATTPVLDDPLTGAMYVRSQNSDDPESGEMFRVALVVEDAERGILVKLPGSVRANSQTGRLTATFDDNPQLPVDDIDVKFTSGPRAALATPPSCGVAQTTAQLTAWSDQSVQVADGFASTCPAGTGGFTPSVTAGTVNSTAGVFSPFVLDLKKPDGNAALNGLQLALPTGLLGSLKGNLGTQVGTVKAFAGSGASPFMLPGRVYLEGAYGDAPFSLRVVVPAKAGPFDLGDVTVRQKIYVDPITAQVTVISDPLPTIVKGVPARLQRLEVNVDKPGFIMNPTSCAAKTITGTLGSAAGQSVVVTNHFQASDCASLDLKPELALSLSGKGQTVDNKHPAVTAVVTQKPGQANLKKVRVALPLSVALDPDNANGLCEFVDGSKTVPTCPKASIIGTATATTPILDEPLSGPVYFVKNIRKDPKSGREIRTLPKLVIPLVGQNGLRLTLTGTSDVDHDQLVTTFDNIPDAPVSSFKMSIIGGKGGILVVSGADICKATQVADQQIDGQNNKSADTDVYIQTPSCPLKVISKKVGKTSVAVKVGGLGAGKITITGKGIRKTTKTIAKSTVATITAKRTKTKPGKVTVSFDPTGPAKARKTSK